MTAEPFLTLRRQLSPDHLLAPAWQRRAAVLTLTCADRRRSRLRAQLDDGRIAGLFLPRGSILHAGDLLVSDDGTLVRIVAAREAVLRVHAPDPLTLLRCAYHLGNRHIPVEVRAEWLQLEDDPVLAEMLERIGARLERLQAPFEPESGAYGGGHRHHHDATFAEDHALVQAAYAHHAGST